MRNLDSNFINGFNKQAGLGIGNILKGLGEMSEVAGGAAAEGVRRVGGAGVWVGNKMKNNPKMVIPAAAAAYFAAKYLNEPTRPRNIRYIPRYR